jgi:hypothetical protein
MAGRLAQSCTAPGRCGYGASCGAGSSTGGPFHFKLYNLDGHTLGNQDNQVMSLSILDPLDTACNTNALPIELLSLQATLLNEVVAISWITASEINNDYFDIERSRNGINFEKIGTKKGAGNSNATINYSLNDAAPFNGINYYRLRQIDYDGKYTYSNIVDVNVPSYAFPVSIFPSPTSGDFTLSLTSETNSIVDIQVFNHIGQLIYSESEEIHSGNFLKSISLNERQDGLYYMRVLANGRSYSARVIKKS